MTIQQLVRGPNRTNSPDFTGATITKAKLEGVTPGLQLVDTNGQEYLIKFDNKKYPELQSGAEVISTKILFAAGYNVPENYISSIDPAKLEIKDGIEIGQGKSKHAFTRDDLSEMLKNAARRQDGTYRVLASKILKGTAKGPYSHVGIRTDDPNDLIPHEHRRDLRGLRVISAVVQKLCQPHFRQHRQFVARRAQLDRAPQGHPRHAEPFAEDPLRGDGGSGLERLQQVQDLVPDELVLVADCHEVGPSPPT